MPDLSRFAAFASKERFVPHVPQAPVEWGTAWGTEKHHHNQSLSDPVPHVPHVPLENDDGWNEEDWHFAFEERAAILEYDGGFPREEAERRARIEIEARRRAAA